MKTGSKDWKRKKNAGLLVTHAEKMKERVKRTLQRTEIKDPPQTTTPTAVVSVHTSPTNSTTQSSQRADEDPPQTTTPTKFDNSQTIIRSSTVISSQTPDGGMFSSADEDQFQVLFHRFWSS
ncbi:hypothetical protein AOLI_G00038150 [Acnodon oligacanthus]